jgi:enoyl-CoA hydratase/carnithine racemase
VCGAGDKIGAEEAVRIGLASRAVPHAQLLQEARKVWVGWLAGAAGSRPWRILPILPALLGSAASYLAAIPRAVPHRAVQMAGKIASHSVPAVAKAKECVAVAQEAALGEGLRFEKREFWSCFALEDQKEGMAAFVQKRAPQWRHK